MIRITRKISCLLLISLLSRSLFSQFQPLYDTVAVGGIKQVISYSASKDLPLMLFLHGGPGSSSMRQAEVVSKLLQKHFKVVQWDQRETGRTLALNKSPVPINIELMENDTYQLIKILLKKFDQERLYLVGESWGTVLGFKMAKKHPELLNAYIAFSPVVNPTKSEQVLLETLKRDAKEKGNIRTLDELNSVKIPFENYRRLYYSRKWMFSYDGNPISDNDTTAVQQYIEEWSKIWLPTWNEAIQQNLFEELPAIRCPVYFFIGKKDLQTNFNIAEDYFKILKAPKKDIFLFDNAGHYVLSEEADRVQRIIIESILEKEDK